jgi:CheY-like chemotaxis protein
MDVNEVIPELGKMLVPLIGETVVLKTDLDRDPLLISIDPGELEQVVLNLVLNARDAMPRGGRVVIRTRRAPAADPQFPAEGPDAPTGVVLSVTDTGMGMHSKTRQRMFEPFYTTKPMGEGTGLGLSTVYGIVKRTGGTIAVDSEPGAGTRMTLWFPAATAAGPSTAVVVEAESQPVAGSERVLVVEDDALVRDFVRRALEEVGYSVSIAASGNDALELLGRDGRDVDLVLTDVVMPGLSGPELAERLTTMTPDTPVLFMSGYIDNSFINTHLRHHPGTLLRKPFTAAELRKRVRRCLDAPGVVPSPDPSPVADHT